MRIRLSALSVLLACAVVLCAADEKSADKLDSAAIRKLVVQLASNDFETREKATQTLSKLEEVPDAVRPATKSDDPEVRRRAESVVEVINARVEARAFKAMVADLQKVEVDRFVSRMVTDPNFAGDKQWEVVQKLTRAVTAKANELSGQPFKIPEPDMKSLPLQRGAPPNGNAPSGKRLLLSDPKPVLSSATGCVILSAGPMPRIGSLSNCIVIVDGDFTGATSLINCLLIVRGNIGRVTTVRQSVILATGTFERATISDDSFYQVSNQQLQLIRSRNNVYIKSVPAVPQRDMNGRVLDTDRAPLQMLKFGAKKDEKPGEEKGKE